MPELIDITSGLKWPEGPIAMPDGSVILCEMFAPSLTRVHPDGTTEMVAEVPGGPNGAALGPDGAVYVCNNGGRFSERNIEGLCVPGPPDMARYTGGRIERVDIATGEVTPLYTEFDGNPFWAPNDIVFDAHGGFYFTDHGLPDGRIAHLTGIYYGKADGSLVREVVFPAREPNGIGLSPDGSQLCWAETWTGRIMQRDIVEPGVLAEASVLDTSLCVYGFSGYQLLDSLAIDADGNICVATLVTGGVSVVSSKGELLDFVATGDPLTDNICFGGEDLTTAYLTLGGTGRLAKTTWPRPGAKLNYLNA
jgi:gluconolactonase